MTDIRNMIRLKSQIIHVMLYVSGEYHHKHVTRLNHIKLTSIMSHVLSNEGHYLTWNPPQVLHNILIYTVLYVLTSAP